MLKISEILEKAADLLERRLEDRLDRSEWHLPIRYGICDALRQLKGSTFAHYVLGQYVERVLPVQIFRSKNLYWFDAPYTGGHISSLRDSDRLIYPCTESMQRARIHFTRKAAALARYEEHQAEKEFNNG